MLDLEEIALVVIGDARSSEAIWWQRWLHGYPISLAISIDPETTITAWQKDIADLIAGILAPKMFFVAHGVGALALLAWQFQADIQVQRRLQGAMLVSPPQDDWREDEVHTLARARFNCRTAVVYGQNDSRCPEAWAQWLAHTIAAKPKPAPQSGHLDGDLDGWQWGMKLMQEMLLA